MCPASFVNYLFCCCFPPSIVCNKIDGRVIFNWPTTSPFSFPLLCFCLFSYFVFWRLKRLQHNLTWYVLSVEKDDWKRTEKNAVMECGLSLSNGFQFLYLSIISKELELIWKIVSRAFPFHRLSAPFEAVNRVSSRRKCVYYFIRNSLARPLFPSQDDDSSQYFIATAGCALIISRFGCFSFPRLSFTFIVVFSLERKQRRVGRKGWKICRMDHAARNGNLEL